MCFADILSLPAHPSPILARRLRPFGGRFWCAGGICLHGLWCGGPAPAVAGSMLDLVSLWIRSRLAKLACRPAASWLAASELGSPILDLTQTPPPPLQAAGSAGRTDSLPPAQGYSYLLFTTGSPHIMRGFPQLVLALGRGPSSLTGALGLCLSYCEKQGSFSHVYPCGQ